MKRTESNPCFYLDLDRERILDEFHNGLKEWSIEEFKTLLNSETDPQFCFDMNLMTQRFIRMNFEFKALKEYYNDN